MKIKLKNSINDTFSFVELKRSSIVLYLLIKTILRFTQLYILHSLIELSIFDETFSNIIRNEFKNKIANEIFNEKNRNFSLLMNSVFKHCVNSIEIIKNYSTNITHFFLKILHKIVILIEFFKIIFFIL